uniref:Ferredoxin:oxidoreductase FAD/NAD(P)-binding:oxidoreductase n=1 Tax=uncultured bacterium 16 TaxID=1748268 RepID=A0A0U3U7W3_9BACT|nr:ferredoxin:oxidoreductase FAD/NAD(P)-binding:oxidoreductase [uncultured bacterium 16]
MAANDRLALKVSDVRCEARDVMVLELRHADGGTLPPFTPGAHLEVYLSDGLIRHYSLCNDSAETDRYCIGVGLARDSRGGSRFVHQTIRVGTKLEVSAPRNNFPLELAAEDVVFIAGGIGITPILSMIRACEARHKPWRLFYCARNRQRTAFYEDLRALAPDRCHFHFDDEQGGKLFDAVASLRDVPDTAHVYTCGPGPLMKAVEAAASSRPQDRVHFEWFTAAAVDASVDKAFTIVLRSSGTRFEVPPGRSILDVLEDNGAGVPYSCREGLCATCRTTVLAGEVDHRDSVLSAAEKASNKEMMICVSRAKSEVLELEL